MIGSNGGLIGARRVPAMSSAGGLWSVNEQSLAKRAGIWPISSAGSVIRTAAGATSNATAGQIGITSQGSGLWWIHKRNAAGQENYLGTVLQALALAAKPYTIGIANQTTSGSIVSYTITDSASYADDPAQDVFWVSFTGPNLVGGNDYIIYFFS